MIEIKDIEKLAELSRIRISPEELETIRKEIDSILGYVGQIQEVSADLDIEPQAGLVRNVMREDACPHDSGIHTEILLAQAPARQREYFKVKKILGGGDVA